MGAILIETARFRERDLADGVRRWYNSDEPARLLKQMNKHVDSADLIVRRADILCPAAQALIAALNAELSATYPEQGACHFRLDLDEVAPGRGAFLMATRAERPVGCGAFRRIDDTSAEVKRMYVIPDERGKGVGRSIVDALESEANRLGLPRLVLETGVRQHATMALYHRLGFRQIPAFGEYVSSPLSVCMEKMR